jgi:UDP-GlcNAc:undecaprenyl-phosphate GlcNAc-1-phosphate transferase
MMALVMGFGLLGTSLAVPHVKSLALKHGVVSSPGGRRMHRQPTPLLGGVAIFLPFAVVFLSFFVSYLMGAFSLVHQNTLQMLSLFLGTAWILVLGTLDDALSIGWKRKLLGQAGGALILVLGGHSIAVATLPFVGLVDFGWTGIPIFILAVVAVTNAVNLIDGIDGLAGGICFFAALTSGIIGLSKGDLFTATVGFTVAGSLLGFLIYNFPPASIFMGDGGSMSMGFLLGALCTSSAAAYPGQRLGTSVMILIPFLPFGIPLLEVALSIARRWLRGQAIFLGDGDHLHHRVTGIIRNARLAVGIFYLFSAALCAFTLFFVLSLNSTLVRLLMVLTAIVLFGGLVASVSLYRVETLLITIRNRPHFKFLGSYLWFMKHKIGKARSLGDLLRLLESGVRDLCFDKVEVLYDGRTLEKWSNPDVAHPGNRRVHEEASFDGSRLTVRWVRPLHEDDAYNEYLRLTWHRFLVALGPEMENYIEELSGYEKSKLFSAFEEVSS